jgi:hypothetical protein
MEQMTKEDFAIPFIRILQSMSPQLKKEKAEFIKGATAGQIFNNVTGELWEAEEGITVVPCAYSFSILEWAPRKSGKGLQGKYTRENCPQDFERKTDDEGKSKDVRPNGNTLQPTAEFYVLLVDLEAGFAEPAVITMSSTQLKKSKKWNALMQGLKLMGPKGPFTPPMYSHVYKLTTGPESNNDGDWYGWKIENVGPVPSAELYTMAKDFSEKVRAGQVQAKYEEPDAEGSAGGNASEVL